jgi:hypothetical protein
MQIYRNEWRSGAAKNDAVAGIARAVKSVTDQATVAAPDIDRAKQIAINTIKTESEGQLKTRESARKIIANLSERSIRNLLGQVFGYMIGPMVVSIISVLASLIAFFPSRI